jgi:hypothetical protein
MDFWTTPLKMIIFFHTIPLFSSSYKGISVHILLGCKAAATAVAISSAAREVTRNTNGRGGEYNELGDYALLYT